MLSDEEKSCSSRSSRLIQAVISMLSSSTRYPAMYLLVFFHPCLVQIHKGKLLLFFSFLYGMCPLEERGRRRRSALLASIAWFLLLKASRAHSWGLRLDDEDASVVFFSLGSFGHSTIAFESYFQIIISRDLTVLEAWFVGWSVEYAMMYSFTTPSPKQANTWWINAASLTHGTNQFSMECTTWFDCFSFDTFASNETVLSTWSREEYRGSFYPCPIRM